MGHSFGRESKLSYKPVEEDTKCCGTVGHSFKRDASVPSRSNKTCGTVGHSFERESKLSYKPVEEDTKCCGTVGHSFKDMLLY